MHKRIPTCALRGTYHTTSRHALLHRHTQSGGCRLRNFTSTVTLNNSEAGEGKNGQGQQDRDQDRNQSSNNISSPATSATSPSPSSSATSTDPTTAASHPPLSTSTPISGSPKTADKPTKEDYYKKFNLKPSAEVGIRARREEKRRLQEEADAARLAAESEARTGVNRLHRLFERLGTSSPSVLSTSAPMVNKALDTPATEGDIESATGTEVTTVETTATTGESVQGTPAPGESWRFLFDEDDLDSKSASAKDNTEASMTAHKVSKEEQDMLDLVPGGSTLFPKLSVYETNAATANTTTTTTTATTTTASSTATGFKSENWKDPNLKSAETDAFKALFSSLFEKKKPSAQEDMIRSTSPGDRVQSLFSNFQRPNQSPSSETSSDREDSTNAFSSLIGELNKSAATGQETEAKVTGVREDPMAVLRRQLQNLSKRVEPIYLERKPKTFSFQAMESTVNPEDLMGNDGSAPKENTLFSQIREENKVAIRMRRELEEKRHDVIKVRAFVDELIQPYTTTATTTSSSSPTSSSEADQIEVDSQAKAATPSTRPSGVSLDGLLSQAILAASSPARLDPEGEQDPTDPRRSLHPMLGQAMVEHTRRQGLTVYIRTVRTECYRALLRSRWDNYQDGAGCLVILKEMLKSGALVDQQMKSVVRSMVKDLKLTATTETDTNGVTHQLGWGEADQRAPLKEMLNVINEAAEDSDSPHIKQRLRKNKMATPGAMGMP
ncbi:hypothetical protein BGW38_000419 [Lunasporangiospora selenospora]|uniref:Mtf2-like C-terminal domain-containing protein n=1 Tax=Lunasporangiospora selenospora TaxID=979761 RepID=A0A9P6KEU5_9FUNG|nr:hypothetical protein BGW38_000419 [Lunasporangiospora selenospora]